MTTDKQQQFTNVNKPFTFVEQQVYERINSLIHQQSYSFISLVHWAHSKHYFHSDIYELWFLEALNVSVKMNNSPVPSIAYTTFGINIEKASEIVLYFIELNAPLWVSEDNTHVVGNTIENALQAGYYFPTTFFDLETVCYFVEQELLQNFKNRNVVNYKHALERDLPQSNTNKHQTKV